MKGSDLLTRDESATLDRICSGLADLPPVKRYALLLGLLLQAGEDIGKRPDTVAAELARTASKGIS